VDEASASISKRSAAPESRVAAELAAWHIGDVAPASYSGSMPPTIRSSRSGAADSVRQPRPDDSTLAAEVDQLVDEQRVSCLWFLRPDYYPQTDRERLRVLGLIERRGDLQAFRRAATLRRWLSPDSSDASAGS
jgi:hypothetical protein